VLHDQLFFMKRCGIDAYALRADKDIEEALAALTTSATPTRRRSTSRNRCSAAPRLEEA
jgi:uncharacterized protein (DUF934 family)